MDLLRFRARLLNLGAFRQPPSDLLHLGCGSRRIDGWLNVDLLGSDCDVDLGCGDLPWPDDSFRAVVSQQVIEHLDLEDELPSLLRELHRVCRPGAEVWLTCPDMEKLCSAYVADRGSALLAGRMRRWPGFVVEGVPTQQIINVFFHQGGEHKNLFDFEMLTHLVRQAGFVDSERCAESDLLARFPGFPRRDDDDCSLYIRTRVPTAG